MAAGRELADTAGSQPTDARGAKVSGAERTYRFPARDRTGLLLGLQAAQCAILGAGVLISGVLLNLAAPAPVVLGVAAGAVVIAFAPVAGRPGYAWLPVATGWVLGGRSGRTWTAAVPRRRLNPDKGGHAEPQPEWPGFLAGIELHEHPGVRAGTTMAVVTDRRSGGVTGLLRVAGREFALIDRSEQDRLLAGWGDALAAFCKERSPVAAVRWFEWSAPADASEHLRWAENHIGPSADPPIVDGYRQMVAAAGPLSTRHETIVTVTVGGTSGGFGLAGRRRRDRALVDTLRDEVRLLADRLVATGLSVEPPLTVGQTAQTLRCRLDPTNSADLDGAGPTTLAGMARVSAPQNAGPMATRTEWAHCAIDGVVHACFAVTEWPRLEVPPNWMEPLLLHAGGIRTIVMHLEPVPPSQSHRRVDKDSTKLIVDAEQRSRSGFRIGARHRRSEADVAARESELVSGYCELEFCGLVTVTATTLDQLERSCAEWEQVAAHAGLELRRLNGQHDVAFACTLPVGIGPSRRSVE